MKIALIDLITEHINDSLKHARANGASSITLLSGDIHKSLGLVQRMPSVCNAMYKCMKENDEIISTTPSGYSSTILIRYYL